MENSSRPELVELTARIVSAFVSNNTVVATDVPHLISETHSALSRASGGVALPEREELRPKVPVKKSVMPDHIVCLEDGKKFKSRMITRWSRPITRRRARIWQRRWDLARGAKSRRRDAG
jgi:predicted transcriptional regulator